MKTNKNNPLWTESDFRKARRMKDILPEAVRTLKRGPGRPVSDNPKQHIGLRLDADIVAWLRSKRGYNALVNQTLRDKMQNADQ